MTGRERLQYLAGMWAKWLGPWDERDRYHELAKASFEALAHGDELATLRNRLAAVEAERDATQKRVQDCETRMMRYAIELAEMQAERDAARAGEARAVEALKRCHEGAARQLAEPRDHNDDQYALTAIATECDAVLAAQGPAIDWLAQQRREAAAEALESVRIGWLSENDYGLGVPEIWRYIADRAAALRAGEAGND